MSSTSISSGSLLVARRLELAAVLAQLRRHPVHPEQLVDLLLGGARVRRLGRVVCHAVFRDVEPALDGGGPERLVVLLRARQVLEQVPEVLGRDDPQVDADPVVRDRPRPRLARRVRLGDQRQRAEGLRERTRVGGGRHQVDVLARVGPAARAAGDLDALGRRLLAQRVPQRLRDLKRLGEQELRLRAAVLAGGECQQDALLRLRAEALELADALPLRRRLQLLERSDPKLVEQPARTLRARIPAGGLSPRGRAGTSPSASPRTGSSPYRAER